MHNSKQNSFAAFVITKDRPEILFSTIGKLLTQTLVPDFILIVDNSENEVTKYRTQQFHDERIGYHFVGYNSGPAGGAYWGLRLLFERGFDWVLWVDDDDPPKFNNLFEDLFQIVIDNDNLYLAMVGAVGERFNRDMAKLIRLNDFELYGYLEVDSISGNMFPLVSKRVFASGILPTSSLFFGFEELAFCLSLKRASFKILISGELHFKHRALAGRLQLKKSFFLKKTSESLWRDYYSVRNLVFIMLHQDKKFTGSFMAIFRNIGKSFFVFKFGFRYGFKSFIMIWKGLLDGVLGRLGMRVLPINKTIV